MIIDNIDNALPHEQNVDPEKYIDFVKMCLIKTIIKRVRKDIICTIKENSNDTRKQLKDFDDNYTNNDKIDVDVTISTFLLQEDTDFIKNKFQNVINMLNNNYKEKYEKIFKKDLNSYITILVKILYAHDHYIVWVKNNKNNNNISNYVGVLGNKDFDDLL